MPATVSRKATVLFGSATRSKVLGVLATSSVPLTGYRVAELTGAQRIKVNRELARLADVGLVGRSPLPGARTGWVLNDRDLRSFLRSQVRVKFVNEWDLLLRDGPRAMSKEFAEVLGRLPDPKAAPEFYRPKGWKPSAAALRSLQEMVRPAAKDRLLRRYGLRTSNREGLQV